MAKNTKEYILEVSLMLFLKKSFKAVTLKDIVGNANVSKGAFYHYFDSKQQLFEEVTKHFYIDVFSLDLDSFCQDSLKEFYQQVLQGTKEAFGSLKTIGGKYQTIFDINHFQLIFEAIKLLPEFSKEMEKHNIREFDSWKNVIETAKNKGEIKSSINTELTAKTFIYLGDGLGMNSIFSDDRQIQKQSFEENKILYDEYYKLLKA